MQKFYMVLPTVTGIIENEKGEILIGKEPLNKRKPYPGFWDLPGGKLEKNEQPEEGAIREIEEETGLNVVNATLLPHVFHHTENTHHPEYTTKNINALCTCFVMKTEGKLNSTELDDLQWMNKSKIKKLKLAPWSKFFLEMGGYI